MKSVKTVNMSLWIISSSIYPHKEMFFFQGGEIKPAHTHTEWVDDKITPER